MTGKQRANLRSLAQKIDPVTQVGKFGVNDALIDSLDKAIEKTHLIKGVTANLSFDSLYVSYTEIVNLLRMGNPDAALNEFVKIEELQKNLVEYIKNNLN